MYIMFRREDMRPFLTLGLTNITPKVLKLIAQRNISRLPGVVRLENGGIIYAMEVGEMYRYHGFQQEKLSPKAEKYDD